jgi:hypothetical protein
LCCPTFPIDLKEAVLPSHLGLFRLALLFVTLSCLILSFLCFLFFDILAAYPTPDTGRKTTYTLADLCNVSSFSPSKWL